MGIVPLRCHVIGDNASLSQYAEVFLSRGHEIASIITADPDVTRWARGRGIRTIDARSDYASELAAEPFDFLFAITHLSRVASAALRLPRRGAIGVHGSLLPRFAGLHSASWAILEREPEFGVTWYDLTDEMDTGDVYLTRSFTVAPGETALSLNTRLFQAAMDSLGELLDRLAAGPVPSHAQENEGRRLYTRHERPEHACILDWSEPAADIDALVRAVDFGRAPNDFAAARLVHRGQALILRSVALGADDAAAPAGTILSASAAGVIVATGDGSIEIREWTDVGGRDISITAGLERLGARSGDVLDALPNGGGDPLATLDRSCVRSERFWRDRLERFEPIEAPWTPAPGARETTAGCVEETFAIPETFRVAWSEGTGDAAALAFAAFIGRLVDADDLSLAFVDGAHSATIDGFESLVSPVVPIEVSLDRAATFGQNRARFAAELRKVRRRGPWWRDLVARYPSLRGRPGLAIDALGPIAIARPRELGGGVPATRCALTVAFDDDGRQAAWIRAGGALSDAESDRLRGRFVTFLDSLATHGDAPLGRARYLSDSDRELVLRTWNDTDVALPDQALIHTLFEEQAARTPDRVAAVFEDESLTYRELDEQTNRLARHLRSLGAGPEVLVGVYVDRSLDLLIATLGILKAGAAYLPLDPAYPRDRIAFMIEDARVPLIVTVDARRSELPPSDARIVSLGTDAAAISSQPATRLERTPNPRDLAYVIYTSGSTGKPKGVEIEHRNVVNFFVGMDPIVPHEDGGVWFAVTSLSFDISVLELFWTLARGFRVVLYLDRERTPGAAATPTTQRSPNPRGKALDFSLFYFAASADSEDKYRLLLEGAKFADENGLAAVWTPERHFHDFGGLYPNPAIAGAAIAVTTKRVSIRAGSVVVPLHHPIRVAEEWAVVDNLSNGRVGIAVASGWMPNDFVLKPENHADCKNVLERDLETIRALWRGESRSFPGPKGDVDIVTLPRPVQPELPIWLTSAGSIDTYRQAGRLGLHLLTHLLGQSIEDLAPKIAAYREARAETGLDPETGIVSLMLHTFVGDGTQDVRSIVREPLKRYLGASASLVKNQASTFFKAFTPKGAKVSDEAMASLSEEEVDIVLEHAFERYYESSGLFGCVESCIALVDRLRDIGVDDIACLLDFGVPTDLVLDNLHHIARLMKRANETVGAKCDAGRGGISLTSQVIRHGVTHLQATPSMARMVTMMENAPEAFRTVKHLFIGGEAFPVPLASDLHAMSPETSVTNMYGPTETTIWSTTQVVESAPSSIPIGRPIANTQVYILDSRLELVAPGLAGEIWIGGDGVARGYLRRPELTEERFRPDPFRPGSRMYRTGDLGRHRADGIIEFLGRADHQIKVHGHRIEPGEIETRLTAHEGVRECVVVTREISPGDNRLLAYFVPTGAEPSAAELRDHLREELPDYMVPSLFVALEALPLTPNGKIDRKALPAPDVRSTKSETAYVAPESDLEARIAALWQDVLGLERVGIDDNFFDIGGHSLLVVTLHRRLRDTIEEPISLTDLYRFPTIRSLTQYFSGDGGNERLEATLERGQMRRAALARRVRRRRD